MKFEMTDDVAKFAIKVFATAVLLVTYGNEGIKVIEHLFVVFETAKAIPHNKK